MVFRANNAFSYLLAGTCNSNSPPEVAWGGGVIPKRSSGFNISRTLLSIFKFFARSKIETERVNVIIFEAGG